MNEFDERQLNVMIQKINAYTEGHLYLSDLIYDLEALANVLINHDQSWQDEFRGYWWDLEQIYAAALANERFNLNIEEQKIINNAVENLKKMIEIKLSSD